MSGNPSLATLTNAPSHIVLRLIRRWPVLGKAVVWAWAKSVRFYRGEPHWLLVRIAKDLGLRLPFQTRLGNGMAMQVYWGDFVSRKIHHHAYYESGTVAVVEKILKPGMVFVDAGAHCGQYSLLAAEKVGRQGMVYSFEPDPNTFRLLASNVRANRLTNVQVHRLALADTDGMKQFHLGDRDNIGANSFVPSIGYSGQRIAVECATLDGMAERTRLTGVDVLKVDVEGAEMSVLRGAQTLLQSPTPPLLIIEFNEYTQHISGSSCQELAAVLRGYGYALFRVGERMRLDTYARNNVTVYFNVLAIPPGRMALLDDPALDLVKPEHADTVDFGVGVLE